MNTFLLITTFLGSIGLTLLTNRLLLEFAKNLGTRGKENIQVRWASTSKPSLGGFAFFLVFLFLIGLIGFLDFENTLFSNKQLLGIFLSVCLGFGIGFADDTYNTNPQLKALGQFSCAVIIYLFDIQIVLFENYPVINFIATSIWVIGLMNSINMLDNMDAVTSSVSILIISIFIVIMIFFFNLIDSNILVLLIGITGSLIGFLYHNWHPAKMYMGDAGSQFLGIFLAIFGIKFLWSSEILVFGSDFFSRCIPSLFVFIIPIIDTSTVIYYRLKRGESPFVGGSDHITHHLVYYKFNERQVVYFFICIQLLCFSLISYSNIFVKNVFSYTSIMLLFIFLLIFSFIQATYLIGKKNKETDNLKNKSKFKIRASIYNKIINRSND